MEIFYARQLTGLGFLAIVWRQALLGNKVLQIFLPPAETPVDYLVQEHYPGVRQHVCPAIQSLGRKLQQFCQGQAVDFSLDMIALDRCTDFQQRVLLAERDIPRGWVSTYGLIARHLGLPGGARAVGQALAGNPFPIVIPCHRAIRSDGRLGGFQGGEEMKRALLRLEDLEVTADGKVRQPRLYYGV